MKKSLIIVSLIVLGIVLFFIIFNVIKTESKQIIPTSTWTKAVCNEENYCLDVQISCGDGRLIDIKPVGEGSYFPKNWIDPRPIELIEKWC